MAQLLNGGWPAKPNPEALEGYREAGDEASAQATLQLGVGLARRISDEAGPHWLIQDLAGIATERLVLKELDPASAYDTAGRTVAFAIAARGFAV